MLLLAASCFVYLGYVYLGVGVLLLPWWHRRGLARLDAAAGAGPWGFRVLISPGLVALWPWLLLRARAAHGHPRPERNAHRDQARPEVAT